MDLSKKSSPCSLYENLSQDLDSSFFSDGVPSPIVPAEDGLGVEYLMEQPLQLNTIDQLHK
jgi:hypothetical protein